LKYNVFEHLYTEFQRFSQSFVLHVNGLVYQNDLDYFAQYGLKSGEDPMKATGRVKTV